MSEQIMWVVKGPAGHLFLENMRPSKSEAELAFAKSISMWGHAKKCGYRCVEVEVRETGRVRITEVQDGA